MESVPAGAAGLKHWRADIRIAAHRPLRPWILPGRIPLRWESTGFNEALSRCGAMWKTGGKRKSAPSARIPLPLVGCVGSHLQSWLQPVRNLLLTTVACLRYLFFVATSFLLLGRQIGTHLRQLCRIQLLVEPRHFSGLYLIPPFHQLT